MSDGSKIEWTDATWNPVLGCDKVSPGCDNCYAIRTAHRMQANPNPKIAEAYAGTEADGEWTGRVNLVPSRLDLPLRWTKPRRIFVNAQSDLFHPDVPEDFIARVWAVMALAPQHTFQILTKRHGRMRSLVSSRDFRDLVWIAACEQAGDGDYTHGYGQILEERGLPWAGPSVWPLPNVWLGVSVEDQARADLRVPALLDTPAAVRFLSCEPLLGPVDLRRYVDPERDCDCRVPLMEGAGQHSLGCACIAQPDVRWVIVGGESGPGARPMNPEWVNSLLEQCDVAGVPFHFKQWGEWGHAVGEDQPGDVRFSAEDGRTYFLMRKLGKKRAGRVLGGRTLDEQPTTAAASA